MSPDPKTETDPVPQPESPVVTDEQPAEKWGGGGRNHKPGQPDKPPHPQPEWGGGGRDAPEDKPEDAA